MSTINDILTQSRSAHAAGTLALKAKDAVKARSSFTLALQLRQDAHTADPDHEDATWLADALHPKMPGETERRYHRVPGKTTEQVARDRHVELIAYFTEKTTDAVPVEVNFTPEELQRRIHPPTDADGQPKMAVEDTEAFKQNRPQ